MLKPFENYYLTHLFSIDDISLIKYLLKDFCLKNLIEIDYEIIYSKSNRVRKRYYFRAKENIYNYKTDLTFETFFLSIFLKKHNIAFYELRQILYTKIFEEKYNFKKIVLEDLKQKKLCFFKYLLTSKGRSLKNNLLKDLKYIEKNVDYLVRYKSENLIELLQKLETNILLLNDDVLKKLKSTKIYDFGFLDSIFENSNFNFDSLTTFDYAFSTNDFSSFDGFGGFDGGDFGGAGAVGDW